ncbi:MAG TPA: DUF6515 family protein [Balneolales bacterium]|nr:DUF6515 family protein [Balneolales bacterium]
MCKMKTIGLFLLFVFAFTAVQAQPRNDHHRRYRDVPRYGHRVYAPPRQAAIVRTRGTVLRYHAGLFYRPFGNSFVIVHAPIGTYVRFLPGERFRFFMGNRVYFYYYANFYTYRNYDDPNSGYVVVDPPVGARIDDLPDGYHKVDIDGATYYLLGNVYYKAILDDHGEVWYEVVGVDNLN